MPEFIVCFSWLFRSLEESRIITPYPIMLPLFRKAQASLMFVIQMRTLHELEWIWDVCGFICALPLLSQWAVRDKTQYTECKRWNSVSSPFKCSSSGSCPAAVHTCKVWMMIALSSMGCFQIPLLRACKLLSTCFPLKSLGEGRAGSAKWNLISFQAVQSAY